MSDANEPTTALVPAKAPYVRPEAQPYVVPDGVDAATYVPDHYCGKLKPNTYCRAWKPRRAAYCRRASGWGTTHPGQGRCKKHHRVGDRNLTHGRYAMEVGGINHPRIADLYARFAADPDPLALFDEIALLRALVVDFIERYSTVTDALLAWHASFALSTKPFPVAMIEAMESAVAKWERGLKARDELSAAAKYHLERTGKLLALLRGEAPERPHTVLDLADAGKLLDQVGKMVERVERMRSANAVSEAELSRIINAMSRVVDVRVVDDKIKEQIREGWLDIVTR